MGALLGWLWLALGLGGACTPAPAPGKQAALVVALAAEPVTLNPVLLADQVSFTVSGLVCRGLTRFRPDLTVVGDLAAAWALSPDGKRLTFRLRRGVKWHDGREVTAQDVVFTYEAVTSPQVPAPLSSQFGPVQAVRALDDYTVAVDYREPYGSALESWSLGLLPHHQFRERPVTDPAFGRQPVGLGPYRVSSWQPGQYLELEAFPAYFAGPPRLARLHLVFLADPAARFLALKAGRVQMLELSPAQYAVIRRQPEEWPRVALHRCPGSRYSFLGFNLLQPRWQDRRVRLALSMAIDRGALLQGVLHGLGRLTASLYPPDTYYYHPNLPLPEYNPARARAALTELGLLPWPQDRPLILSTNYENKEHLALAEIIQRQFADLGLPVQIRTYDWVTFRHVVIEQRQFDLVLLSRSYLPDPDLYPLWHSSQTRKGAWNFLSYRNPEVDRLLEAGRRTLDPVRRRQLYCRLQELMRDDPPCLLLFAADTVYAVPKNLRGLQPGPLEIFHNIHEWSWAADAAR